MRKLLLLLPVGLLLLIVVHQYLRPTDGRTVLARAVEAHGGEAALLRTRTGHLHGTGQQRDAQGRSMPFVLDEWFQAPDAFKRTLSVKGGDEPVTFTFLAPAGKCWKQVGGKEPVVRQCDPAELEGQLAFLPQMVEIHQAGRALPSAGTETVQGRPAVGFETASGDWGRTSLYFDRERSLCVMLRKQHGPRDAGIEIIYDSYREMAGVMVPTKIVVLHHRRLDYEVTLDRVEFTEQIDAGTFAPP